MHEEMTNNNKKLQKKKKNDFVWFHLLNDSATNPIKTQKQLHNSIIIDHGLTTWVHMQHQSTRVIGQCNNFCKARIQYRRNIAIN